MYRTSPDGFIRDIFRITGPVRYLRADWKPGRDHFASIKRVTALESPIHLAQLKRNKILRTAGFVRAGIRGRCRVSDWAELYDLVVSRNPSLRRQLSVFGPHRVE